MRVCVPLSLLLCLSVCLSLFVSISLSLGVYVCVAAVGLLSEVFQEELYQLGLLDGHTVVLEAL